ALQDHAEGRALQSRAEASAGRPRTREGADRAHARDRQGRRSRARIRREISELHRQGSDPQSRADPQRTLRMHKTAPIFVLIPPPIWGLIYELLAWVITDLVGLSPILGWILIAAGIVVAASGLITFGRAGTETNPASEKNTALVTHGPYRY